MNDTITPAWRLYEAGTEYNRKINLYETVRRNERFYRGDQWQETGGNLPHPVFNLIRRIVDYLVGSQLPESVSIHYADDRLPFIDNAATRDAVADGLRLLEQNAAYRWKQDRMDDLSGRILLDAAVSGDAVLYCWWDPSRKTGTPFSGDIRTDLIDGSSLFLANVNSADIQSQEYVMLAGRDSVASLRREALENGVSVRDAERIIPDDSEKPATPELLGNARATYLLRFYRENGEVILEKSTRRCVIRRIPTGLTLYPVVLFNWFSRKGSYHGTAPISEMISNQVYLNSAYALAMKHMSDTAFSKVIYDKARIPQWSNEVGEAIAAVGGGNVSDAVSVVGVGQMQEGYLDLIQSVIENTKTLMGATSSALGDERANNTSAILALQEAAGISLRQVKARFCRCLGDLANIWANMLCAYCPPERMLAASDDGTVRSGRTDYRLLSGEMLRATAEVASSVEFSSAAAASLLNDLLTKGLITVRQYLRYLPDGCVKDRNRLLQELEEPDNNEEERHA